MKITISVLFFYNKSLSVEFIDQIIPTLEGYLDSNPADTIELVLTDNTPPPEKILEALDDRLKTFEAHPRLIIVASRNEANLGFGKSHNRVFDETSSDVFVLLNNDIFFSDDSWLSLLIAPLSDEKNTIAGLKNAPRILSPSGNGTWAKSSAQAGDYVEGSVLAVRSAIAKKHGLFANDLPWAYFEDSDLCLRYRQMDYRIAEVEIVHEHRRSASTKKIPEATLLSIRERNRSRFLARWSGYLNHRKLTNRILLDLRTDGWGDVIASLPSVFRILNDHPTAQVDVRLENALMKEFFEIDRVNVLVGKREEPQNKQTVGYDRAFFLSEVDFHSPLYLGAQIAASLGVDFDIGPAREYFKKKVWKKIGDPIQAALSQPKKIAVIHAESQRQGWEGRAIPPQALMSAVEYLKNKNYFVTIVGADAAQAGTPESKLIEACDYSLIGKTSLAELARLLSHASLYVGIDSGPLHLAQLLGVSTFAVFGATLSSSKLLVEEGHTGFADTSLDCLGCYHLKRGDAYNYCIRRDQACVKKISEQAVTEALESHLASAKQKPRFSIEHERKTYALKIEPTLRIRSTIDEYRFKELCVALKNKVIRMMADRIWK